MNFVERGVNLNLMKQLLFAVARKTFADVEGTSNAEHFAESLGFAERVSCKLRLCSATAFTRQVRSAANTELLTCYIIYYCCCMLFV